MTEKIEVILVDIGNSKIKSAEVVNGAIAETRNWESLSQILHTYNPSIPLMVCSTRKLDRDQLKDRTYTLLSHQTPMPILLDYETPETLGADRIAAAVGAMDLFPNENTLLIDLGTCMTIDLIDKDGVFRGGVISPGLRMRMKSMANYTDNLPDISEEWESLKSDIIGKSTKQCLLSGSYWSMMHEMKGIISAFEKDFTTLNVILSGGDADFFESMLKAHIFAGSKIVQQGLYRIWKYQFT